MKFDDVLDNAAQNPSDDPEEMSRFIDQLIDAEDISETERSVFCAGYMAGMSHALGIVAKSLDPMDIVGEMIAKEHGWASRGLLD